MLSDLSPQAAGLSYMSEELELAVLPRPSFETAAFVGLLRMRAFFAARS